MRLEFDDLGNALGAEIVRCYGMDNAAMLARRSRNTRPRVAIRHSTPTAASWSIPCTLTPLKLRSKAQSPKHSGRKHTPQ